MKSQLNEKEQHDQKLRRECKRRGAEFVNVVMDIVKNTVPDAFHNNSHIYWGGQDPDCPSSTKNCLEFHPDVETSHYGFRYYPTGKLRIRFNIGPGSYKCQSFPEPKKGFDPKLWADKILKRMSEIEDQTKEQDQKQVKIRSFETDMAEIIERYPQASRILSAHEDGIRIVIGGLTKEDTLALVAAEAKIKNWDRIS